MSNGDEYELNFLKIDSNNNAKLMGIEDIELEMLDLMACVSPFEAESMDGILLKFFKKFIPTIQDLLKTNIELSRQFLKHSDKKGLNFTESINRILSTDFKEKFIFNKINIQDVCNILTISFNDIKKFKISNFAEFQVVLKKLNFKKYNLDKLYLNNEYIKNKMNSHSHFSSLRTISSMTSNSTSLKEVEEASEIDDMTKNMNKYHNKPLGIIYIDNNIKNIINSSSLNSDYDYNEEELNKRLLTKECFAYQKNNKDEGELPIELIILLYKLKNVKTLIYQINNIDEQFFKMANFIFLNIKWLFMNEIEEIIFDLGNETLQKGINDVFNERASEIYYNSQMKKNAIYYNGSYKARTINCWEPECDIFFDKIIINENKKDYIYSEQSNNEKIYFDNHLCNIYNEFGNLTNLKYIRPIIYTYKNNDYQNEQKLEEYDDIVDNYINSENNPNRIERESIYLNNNNNNLNSKNTNLNSSTNQNLSNVNIFIEKTTPALLKEFVRKHIFYFQMIPLYSYFFMKDFKKIKKLGLYFHKSYSFEIQIMLKLFDVSYDRFHFLNFISGIDTLTEADFSFNSLDNKSFENILGIINKNANLTSLRISFFTTEINYFINSLLNIWSSKKLSIRKIFLEQKEFLINNTGDKERDMNYFILNHNRFLEGFCKNLRNLFNLLKVKTLNNLEELILRFDIPLQILNSEKYIIILVKFIINIFIMLTFQENRIHTLKILAPELPFHTAKMPYIRNLFKEILLLERENIDERFEVKMKNDKKRKDIKRKKDKEKELKEREKENELKEKNARKDYLENVSNIPSNFSTKDVVKTLEDDNNLEIDIDDNLAQYDYSKRFKSVFQKKKNTIIKKESGGNETMGSDQLLIEQRRQLNNNDSLENITIQIKIYNLPEIFNIMIMNNLVGLKSINLGYLDEITFVSFIKDFKLNVNQLHNLTSLKISLGPSVISYNSLEKNIHEFINTNSPMLEEKFLFSDLKIVSEAKMTEFVDLVYYKALVPKLVIQIGNDNDNIHLLCKVIDKFIKSRLNEMYSLIMLMDLPQYKPLYTMNIIRCLASFYSKKENSAILCKENPNN